MNKILTIRIPLDSRSADWLDVRSDAGKLVDLAFDHENPAESEELTDDGQVAIYDGKVLGSWEIGPGGVE